jgi:hypothetical protein
VLGLQASQGFYILQNQLSNIKSTNIFQQAKTQRTSLSFFGLKQALDDQMLRDVDIRDAHELVANHYVKNQV